MSDPRSRPEARSVPLPEPLPDERLDSWKHIAAYLKRDVRTVQRWENREELPVHRHRHALRSTPYAFKSELDRWWTSRGAVLDVLPPSGAASPLPIPEPEPATTGTPKHGWRNGKALALVAIPVLMVLGAAGLWVVRNGVGRASAGDRLGFAARDWVLIARFENRTGEPLLDGTLEYALAGELSNSRFVNVVPRERVEDVLRLMKRPLDTPLDLSVAREICLRDGDIRALVTGRVEKFGSGYVLSAQLVEPARGLTVASGTAEAEGQRDILAAMRRQSTWVREALGESLTSIQQTTERLEKATTPSLAALRSYSEAFNAGSRDEWAAAENLARAAIAVDPAFASAHIWLAWAIRNQRPEASTEYLPPAEQAVRLAAETSKRERYFILGSYYTMTGECQKAIGAFEAHVRVYADDYWGWNNLAHLYPVCHESAQEAVPSLVRAADLRPNDPRAQFLVARALAIWAKDRIRARPYRDKATSLALQAPLDGLSQGWLAVFPAFDLWLQGDVERAARELDVLARTATTGPAGRQYELGRTAGQFYLGLGELKAAEEVLTRIDDILGDGADGYLHFVAFAREDRAGVWKHARPPRRNFGPTSAIILARTGLLKEARQVLANLRKARNAENFMLVPEGELALRQGEIDRAMGLLTSGIEAFRETGMSHVFLGIESLAEILVRRGAVERAIAVLEEAGQDKVRTQTDAVGPSIYFWLRTQVRLAQLYRQVGRRQDAERLGAQLLRLLSQADPDFPLLIELKRLRAGPAAPVRWEPRRQGANARADGATLGRGALPPAP